MHTHIYICIRTYAYTYLCIHMYIYIHIHTAFSHTFNSLCSLLFSLVCIFSLCLPSSLFLYLFHCVSLSILLSSQPRRLSLPPSLAFLSVLSASLSFSLRLCLSPLSRPLFRTRVKKTPFQCILNHKLSLLNHQLSMQNHRRCILNHRLCILIK